MGKSANDNATSSLGNLVYEDRGISDRALSIARVIDRLPAGEFCIILKKDQVKTVPWHAVFSAMERLQVMDLSKDAV